MVRQWLWRMNGNHRIGALKQKRSIWSADKLRALFAMKASGHPIRTCTRILGVTPGALARQWLTVFGDMVAGKRRSGPPRPARGPRGRKPRLWPPERVERLRDMRDSGMSWDEITSELGVSKEAAANAAWRFGIRENILLKHERMYHVGKKCRGRCCRD
jgi:hypothetical protein